MSNCILGGCAHLMLGVVLGLLGMPGGILTLPPFSIRLT